MNYPQWGDVRRSVPLRGAITLAAAAVLAALGVSAPAGAAPGDAKSRQSGSVTQGVPVPAGAGSWAALWETQERMNAAARGIIAGVRGTAESGYAGIVADPTRRELKVYWKGRPPAGLIRTASAKIPVKVLPAAYSERELAAATKRILARAGDKVTMVGPRADGSGLLVGTVNGLAQAADYAGVPVTVRTGVSPRPATRWDDSPPWWGGGAWINATRGGWCSTGFAVRHQGVARILTAAHCGSQNDLTTDSTGQTIGVTSSRNTGTDTMIINASSAGRVFNNTTDAAGNPTSEFTNAVIGSWTTVPGNFVCTSGAGSGTRCSIQVVQTGLCITIRDFGRVCNQVMAEQTGRVSAIGQGDSGGPVIVVAANNTQVYAAGTNSAMDDIGTAVACTGYVPTGRVCAWRMFFEDIGAGMAGVGATSVVTG